jgi:hypothetical protein
LLAYQNQDAVGLLPSVPEENREKSWWLILHDGTPVPGDEGGGVLLMSEMRSTRLIGSLLIKLHLSPLIDALDRLVARRRGRLSRYVPDVPVIHRYP